MGDELQKTERTLVLQCDSWYNRISRQDKRNLNEKPNSGFGPNRGADIYCPWDVINHVELLCKDSKAEPKCYWINSSGNSLVKRFITKANKTTRDEIERLIAGEPIEKPIRLELTYDEIDNSIDNIWSVLFTTGYLTQVGMTEQGAYKLIIPNKEVREVYKLQIQDWFDEKLRDNTKQLTAFWNSIEEGKTTAIEQYLNRTLSNSISVFDTKAPENEKER